MRKAQKKPKREIKINEKQPMEVYQEFVVPKEVEFSFYLVTCLDFVKENLIAHRNIWNEELKNGGFLNAYYKISLSRMIKLCDMIAKPFKENGVEKAPFAMQKIGKKLIAMGECEKAQKKDKASKILYQDDTLPNSVEFLTSFIVAKTYAENLNNFLYSFAKRSGQGELLDEFLSRLEKWNEMFERDLLRRDEDTTEYDRKLKKLLTKKKIEFLRKHWIEEGLIA